MEILFPPGDWRWLVLGISVVVLYGLLWVFQIMRESGVFHLHTGSRLVKFWFRVKHPLDSVKREEAEYNWGYELARKQDEMDELRKNT